MGDEKIILSGAIELLVKWIKKETLPKQGFHEVASRIELLYKVLQTSA